MKRIFALTLILCLFFAGCESPKTAVEKMIDQLTQQEISLDLGDEIEAIQNLLSKLNKEELEKIVDLEKFQGIVEKYKVLEDKAAQELEELIDKLPPADEIKESSREAIQKALEAYDKASDAVKEKVENSGILEEAKKQLEKLQTEN